MPGNPEELSIAGFNPEIEVFARQHNLKEVLVVKKAILVRVVIVNQLLAVSLRELYDSIIPQKAKNTGSIKVFFSCPIDAHEGTVWGKVRIRAAQDLSEVL